MKNISLFTFLIFASFSLYGQRQKLKKITKDTIVFNIVDFKPSYIKQNEFIPLYYKDLTYGIFFKTKRNLSNLDSNNIKVFKCFIKETNLLESSNRDKTLEGKLFNRLNNKIIIIVDDSNDIIKFLEVDVGLFSID